MTKPIKDTSIVLIIDRSGSMRSISAATQDALEEFINKQKELEGNLRVDTVFFDDKYEERAKDLDPKTADLDLSIQPRGMTAMFDAIGRKINDFSERIGKTKNTVLFVIATDGLENASREYAQKAIADLIKEKQDAGWNFTFIGANQDAVTTAKGLNISEKDSITFSASVSGVSSVMRSMSAYTSNLRAGSRAGYSDKDRNSAMDDEQK